MKIRGNHAFFRDTKAAMILKISRHRPSETRGSRIIWRCAECMRTSKMRHPPKTHGKKGNEVVTKKITALSNGSASALYSLVHFF